MFGLLRRRKRLALVACALLLLLALFLLRGVFDHIEGPSVAEATELRGFVSGKPPTPVVFTSRSSPASLIAAAPEAEGFTYPGTIPWTATEGRLRLLDTDGKVYELTWQRTLPDGGTLIDVMSPTITADGKRVLFAGRRAPPDPGRWRIYEVGVDGRDLKQVTGRDDDPGCVSLPPLRFASDGSRLPDAERKRLDYDDVDPTDDGAGGIIFASSRLPDLGRDHSRRATQIWHWSAGDKSPHTLTANRNNDRWPFYSSGDAVLFSMWSRNREAVTEDRTDIQPVTADSHSATQPTDQWMGMRVFPDGTQFGYAIKIPEPVWRPRPLFNGRIAFTTPTPDGGYRIAAADWGYLRLAPSSLASDSHLPHQSGGEFVFGPSHDAEGRMISASCPSPCPPVFVLFAGAPVGSDANRYGLYVVPESFVSQVPQLLFDDPNLVDAEPVGVYARKLDVAPPSPRNGQVPPERLKLFSERWYAGPSGQFHNNLINAPMPDPPFHGQRTNTGQTPVIPHPQGIKFIAVYGAHRDRFDDPVKPRIRGGWEKLLVSPLDKYGFLDTWIPANPLMPVVIAGLDEEQKVFKWSSKATDSDGRAGTYYAIAGDHYSGVRAGGYHFCLGCHTGHTFITLDVTERLK